MAAEATEVAEVRRQIAEERAQLSRAVVAFEQSVGRAVSRTARIGGRALVVAGGAFAIGFALGGGFKAARRLRSRQAPPRRSVAARVGRYALVRLR